MKKYLREQTEYIAKSSTVRAYMPGHKGRLLSNTDWGWLDITEVPGADNLHDAKGVIVASQAAIARRYHARRTHLLVNGTTGGIHAAMMAALSPGDKVLLSIDSHRCVFGGMALAQAEGVYLTPECDGGIYTHINSDTVAQALDANPTVRGMVMTNPTYYGTTSDVAAIADILHARGKWLIVDEAHGAHLAFSDALPADSLSQGADIVVQSAHKTLGAFTQSAMLHVGSERISDGAVSRVLAMMQSSSPSYPMMMGIEAGVAQAEAEGAEIIEKIIGRWDAHQAAEQPGMNLNLYKAKNGYPQDKTKWVFTVADGNGHVLERQLRKNHGIWCEFATATHLLCYFGMGTTVEDLDRVEAAIAEVNQPSNHPLETPISVQPYPVDYTAVVSPYIAMTADIKRRPLADTVGQIAGDFVVPYPPGVPVLLPGNRITQEMIEAIQEGLDRGDTIMGCGDGQMAIACEMDRNKQEG